MAARHRAREIPEDPATARSWQTTLFRRLLQPAQVPAFPARAEKATGLGGPGDAGSVLAPPNGGGGNSDNAGIVISSQPGSKVGIPGTGGKGSFAMSPSGGDTAGPGRLRRRLRHRPRRRPRQRLDRRRHRHGQDWNRHRLRPQCAWRNLSHARSRRRRHRYHRRSRRARRGRSRRQHHHRGQSAQLRIGRRQRSHSSRTAPR